MFEHPEIGSIGLTLGEESIYNSIIDFIDTKEKDDWLLKNYGSRKKDWAFNHSDSDVIQAWLEETGKKYIFSFIYDGNCNYFSIIEVWDSLPKECDL